MHCVNSMIVLQQVRINIPKNSAFNIDTKVEKALGMRMAHEQPLSQVLAVKWADGHEN